MSDFEPNQNNELDNNESSYESWPTEFYDTQSTSSFESDINPEIDDNKFQFSRQWDAKKSFDEDELRLINETVDALVQNKDDGGSLPPKLTQEERKQLLKDFDKTLSESDRTISTDYLGVDLNDFPPNSSIHQNIFNKALSESDKTISTDYLGVDFDDFPPNSSIHQNHKPTRHYNENPLLTKSNLKELGQLDLDAKMQKMYRPPNHKVENKYVDDSQDDLGQQIEELEHELKNAPQNRGGKLSKQLKMLQKHQQNKEQQKFANEQQKNKLENISTDNDVEFDESEDISSEHSGFMFANDQDYGRPQPLPDRLQQALDIQKVKEFEDKSAHHSQHDYDNSFDDELEEEVGHKQRQKASNQSQAKNNNDNHLRQNKIAKKKAFFQSALEQQRNNAKLKENAINNHENSNNNKKPKKLTMGQKQIINNQVKQKNQPARNQHNFKFRGNGNPNHEKQASVFNVNSLAEGTNGIFSSKSSGLHSKLDANQKEYENIKARRRRQNKNTHNEMEL